jgi:hypothetical protein
MKANIAPEEAAPYPQRATKYCHLVNAQVQ